MFKKGINSWKEDIEVVGRDAVRSDTVEDSRTTHMTTWLQVLRE